MDLKPDTPSVQTELPAEQFHGSWRSGLGVFVGFFWALAAGTIAGAVALGGGAAVALGFLGVLLGWLAWWISQPLRGNNVVIGFGPDGIRGRNPGLFNVPWHEVADVRAETVQGNVQIVIRVLPPPGQAPKKSWLAAARNEKRVALTGLNAKLHPEVIAAAYRHFDRHGGARAVQAAQQHEEEAKAHTAFDEKLVALTPRVWAMPLMMLLCAAVWVVNVVSGMSVMQPPADELFRWGANSASAVQAGQWWRMVTAMFLHGGILHLALNMYALWEAGLMVTRLFGNRGFLVVYFGAGLVGNALSLHFSGQTGVSVGASGAVFGVAGALLAAVIQHRGKFPMGRSKQMLMSLGLFIFYSLAYGFSRQGIDNAAHVGGLLAGLVAGWLLVEKIDDTVTPLRRQVMMAVAAALCGAATVALVVYTPPAKRDIAVYFSDIKRWNELQKELTTAMQALRADADQSKAGKMEGDELVRRFGSVHAPALRRIASAFDGLRLPADELTGKYAAAQGRYAAAVAALIEADAQRMKAPSPEISEKVERLAAGVKEANAAIAALNAEAAEKKR